MAHPATIRKEKETTNILQFVENLESLFKVMMVNAPYRYLREHVAIMKESLRSQKDLAINTIKMFKMYENIFFTS